MERAEVVYLLGALLCILLVGLFVGDAHVDRPLHVVVRKRANMIVFFIVIAVLFLARLCIFGLTP